MKERRGWRYAAQVLLIAVGTTILTLVFFCPKFVFWKALPVDEIRFLPEVNRARAALQQLDDPFVSINDPVNRAIQWRLLFPLIGHYLHFPRAMYLAMPWIGCVLVLVLVAHIVLQNKGTRRQAMAITVLIATSSWFFVSTGWLSYLDSWFVLALLIVSFASSPALLAIACLLAPWVDERFAIGLPLAVVARAIYFMTVRGKPLRSIARDGIAIAAPVIIYLIARVVLFRSADTASSGGVHDTLQRIQNFGHLWPRTLLGLWMALRMQWFLAVGALVLLSRSRRWPAVMLLALAMIATIAVSAVVADDISRSCAVLITASVLGAILFVQQSRRLATQLLLILAAANLLLPASHVVYQFSVPIESSYSELDRWNHPPDFVDPNYYVRVGAGAMSQQNYADARRSFDIALKFDPRHARALMNRAWLNIVIEDIAAAVRDADSALSVDPGSADCLYTSAVAHLHNGEIPLAVERATHALRNAPPDWPRRKDCAALIQRINNATQSGR